MLSRLLVQMVARPRVVGCRRTGHNWTVMSSPPACTLCGRTRPANLAQDAALDAPGLDAAAA